MRKIAIIGGGQSGLQLALGLQQNNYDVTVVSNRTPEQVFNGRVTSSQFMGFSLYNAGTVSVRKAFSHHYNFLTNYTFSKSIDIATTVNLPNTPLNYLHPELDRAVGDNDVRHRFTLALLAETPKAWNVAVRDFKFSVLTSLQSPRHFTINAAPPQGDLNGDNFTFNDRMAPPKALSSTT